MLITSVDKDIETVLRAQHDGAFPFPDLSSDCSIIKRAVIDHGEIIGAAVVRVTTEAVLLMSTQQSISARVWAIRALIDTIKEDLKKLGIEDCHAFVRDPNVKNFLNSCGFEDSISGQALVYKL